MNLTENEKIQFCALLIKLVDIPALHIDSTKSENKVVQSQDNSIPEMLTIKECITVVKGISEHSLRLLVKQNKIPSTRARAGKNGKILVNKKDLLDYYNG